MTSYTDARVEFFQIDNKRRLLCSDGWIYGQDGSGRLLVCRPGYRYQEVDRLDDDEEGYLVFAIDLAEPDAEELCRYIVVL